MTAQPFGNDPRQDTRKPHATRRVVVDRSESTSAGLRTVILFEGRLVDIAQPARVLSKRGAVVVSRGVHGAQARTSLTGSVGTAFSPAILLSPEDAPVSAFTLSSLVRFDGATPPTGSFSSIGAALGADDSGRMPLFISSIAGTFRAKATGEFEFLSGGSPLSAASLSGWHRLTATVSGSAATLYVDGGVTWIGSATLAFANFSLRSLLGSDITAGTEFPWPVADLFYWSRALSSSEVLNQAQRPYIVLADWSGDRWLSVPTTQVVERTGNPWDDPFTDDFGPGISFGVLAQPDGAGSFSASAVVFHQAGSSIAAGFQADGAAFLQPAFATVIKPVSAAFAGTGAILADPRLVGTRLDGNAVGTVITNPSVLRSVRGDLAGVGGMSAVPGARYSVRGAMQGVGGFLANAVVLLPFNRAQAALGAAGGFTANPITRAAPRTAAVLSGVGQLSIGTTIQKANSRAVLIGEAHLRAKPRVRKKPRVRPGMAAGSTPDLVALEVETYLPGIVGVTATAAHGTRAHGTLSRQPPSKLENTGMIRASDIGYRTAPTDQDGPTPYPPLISGNYQIDAALNLEPSRTTASAAWGAVLLANPDRRFDSIIGVQNSDGRALRMLSGSKGWDSDLQYLTDPTYASLTTLFSGLATPWSLTDEGLSIPLRDATYFLEKPLQSDTYGGSGGLDGTPDLAGKPKPIMRGGTTSSPIQNVSPVLVDPVNRIYQYSDAPAQVVNLYEGAATGAGAITFAGDTTNLYAGSTPFGQYRTDNSRALFQLGSVPVGQITIDAIGLFQVAGAVSNPFLIVRYLIGEDMAMPSTLIDGQSFADIAAAYPTYVGGLYFGSDEAWSCIQAIDSSLTSLGANIVPTRDGRLRLTLLRQISSDETVTATYDESQILQLSRRALPSTLDPPPYRIRVGYAHNFTVMSTGINPTLSTATRRQFVVSPDRYAAWNDPTLLSAYRRPNDYEVMPGPMLTQAGAQAVANDLGALWGQPRRLYDVTLPRRMFGRELGDVVHIHYPVEQLTNGQDGRIVGYSLRSGDGTVTYSVLV